jgi:poly-gamma-glutamate synthesis protein (capsule biosynthesis protein)
MNDRTLKGIALATFIFTGGFLWFLAQAFNSTYQATLAVGAERSIQLSELINERALPNFSNQTSTIYFVGDIMLSRAVGSTTARLGDYRFPFLKVANELGKADITFGNLEGPISDRGENKGSIYSFRADSRMVEGLKYAGFDVMSVANNHIWDYGVEALLDTVDILNKAGIKTVGAGKDITEANASAEILSKGTKVAFLGYTDLYPESLVAGKDYPGISDFSEGKIIEDIKKAKLTSHLVVVSIHWGEEYQTESNDSQKNLARKMVEAGASLVIGHHPHVPQEWEQYKDGWIFYSLGNFIFDQTQSVETMRGMAVRAVVKGNKVVSLETIPVQISPSYQPSLGNPQKIL